MRPLPLRLLRVGAAGTLLLAAVFRELSIDVIGQALGVTLKITAMIMLIVTAGTMFTSIFAVNGGGAFVRAIRWS